MLEKIEEITTSMEIVEEEMYMKQQLAQMAEIKPKIGFEQCHSAISKNGGLMAFVKKSDTILMDPSNPITSYIRIFCQNGSNERRIKFDTDKKDKFIVLFEFTDNEKLYCIFQSGTIIKFDIFTSTYITRQTGNVFLKDNILKAKLFGEAFGALTKEGVFYYIHSLKEPLPTLFYDIKGKQGIDPYSVTDFTFIQPEQSQSGKLELVFATQNIHGVINIVEKTREDTTTSMSSSTSTSTQQNRMMIPQEYNEIYHIRSNTRTEYIKGCGCDTLANDDLGFISAIAVSPRQDRIALYRKETDKLGNAVFIFNINFNTMIEARKSLRFNLRNLKDEKKDREEIQNCLSFDSYSQFLWCGEDGLCVCSKRFVCLIDFKNRFFRFQTYSKKPPKQETYQLMKCISESDGLRVIMHNGVYFINKVAEEINEVCYFMSESPAKKLIVAYNSAEEKRPDCDGEIRALRNELGDAVKTLLYAAALLWKGDVQMILLRAAQHGKDFLSKEDFNFNEFVTICKDIRIVNSLRRAEKPRLITFPEYKMLQNDRKLSCKPLIKRLIRTQEFFLAEEISKQLMLKTRNVYQKWVIAQLKALSSGLSEREEKDYYTLFYNKIKNIPAISFIKLAKKAFKYNKEIIGINFLENEKSILTKIPQYLQLKKWDTALNLALETYDSNIIFTVIDKIFVVENLESFRSIVSKHKKADSIVLEYLKKHQSNYYQQYLEDNKLFEELFYHHIEQYFNCDSLDDRRLNLERAKALISNIKGVKDTTFDYKFYQTYIYDIEESQKMKKDLLREDVIKQTDISPFDSSTFDIYRTVIEAGKYPIVEKRNKIFEVNAKLLNILRIRTYGKLKSLEAINSMRNDIKKTSLTYLNFAELYVDLGEKNLACECIKMITEPEYFDHKIELLKSIDKLPEALEIIISDKNYDRKLDKVQEILNKNNSLKQTVNDLCAKYNIILE